MSKEDNYEDSFGVLGTLALAAAAGWVIHSINKSGKEAQAKREAQKQEEERRRNSPLSLNNGITLNEFVSMANHIASRTKRITCITVDGLVIHATVQSQSHLTEWNFSVDFNDYGHLTGKYWLSSDNDDSIIPQWFADKLSTAIKGKLPKQNISAPNINVTTPSKKSNYPYPAENDSQDNMNIYVLAIICALLILFAFILF
ncbi:hypothetical protein [uncultured Bifidobacterium sp.]|uniref:hypothetical protein n=1 Tax=uncultured Bifidobacterium sp. TaxID=165187 RepID=UPI0025950FDA|nr:hypothetical protein [uncultured Bifidobacterium sp.]